MESPETSDVATSDEGSADAQSETSSEVVSGSESASDATVEQPKKKKAFKEDTSKRKHKSKSSKRDASESDQEDRHKRDKRKSKSKRSERDESESEEEDRHKSDKRKSKTKRSKRDESESEEEDRHKSDKKKTNTKRSKVVESESEEEPDGESCDEMTTDLMGKYRGKVRKFIKSDNMFGFVKVLTESPLATVLENMHYIFVAASNNDQMVQELTRVNQDFNIVSKKFIKAIHESQDCRHKYAESEEVAESIQSNTPLKQIEGISEYTPELIIMKTIQTGDLVTCNLMLKKWKVAPMFAECKSLIAAFYGWEDFFGETERFTKSQDLVVHALCGGYKRLLRKVCGGSGAKWVIPETLQKAGLVCPVRADMKARFKKQMNSRG